MSSQYYRTGATSRVRGTPLYQLAPVRKRPYSSTGGTNTPAKPRMGRRVRRRVVPARQIRKRKIGRKVRTGDNSSFSYCKIVQSWKRIPKTLYKQVVGRQTILDQYGFSTSCGTGKQALISLPFMTATQLAKIKLACNNGVATNNDVRCFIGRATQRVYLRNTSNTVAKVMIYDLLPKRDSVNPSLDDPNEAWNKGYTDMGLTSQSTVVGNTPNFSPEFRQFWKIHKVTTVNMEAGEQHDHIMRMDINKIVPSTRWDSSQSQYFRGLSAACLVVFHGTLAHERDTPTSVSFVDIRMDYAVSQEYSFGYIQQNTPSYTNDRVYGTVLLNPEFMGESGDAERAPMNA